MKKIYLILLMLLLLFIPATNAVAIYQLDQPISDFDGYTLRQVFQNRNMAMPDLTNAYNLGGGNYRLFNDYGVTLDYNVNSGIYNINGNSNMNFSFIFPYINQNKPITISQQYVSGYKDWNALFYIITYYNSSGVSGIQNVKDSYYTINDISNEWGIFITSDIEYINYQFKIQLEQGSQSSPYQIPSNGPYSDVDLGQFNLTSEQIQTYYNLYLEAVRFEQENQEARQDEGGYQNIFRSIINAVRNLIVEMGNVWSFLNAPIMTSDIRDFKFEVDWSWDLIGMLGQVLSSVQVLTLQVLLLVPSLVFQLFGVPIQVSLLSLLFSNFIFLLLGWIVVKSFVI